MINNNEGFITFTSIFKYLGSMIDFLLDDSTDIKNRITNANKAIRALSFIWDSAEILIETKIQLYLAILINLVL